MKKRFKPREGPQLSGEITMAQYTQDWFVYERCPYIQGLLRRGGKYSRTFAKTKRSQLRRYILPVFGDFKLQEVTADMIEDWLFGLKDEGLAHITINHIFSTLRLILGEAYRKAHIPDNPSSRVKPFIAEKSAKGTLTQEEVNQLFGPGALETIWRGDLLHYLLNLTASQTGMRLGELQALKKQDIETNFIRVRHSWERSFGEKSTKNGQERIVPVSIELTKQLKQFAKTRDKGPYIFSYTGGIRPLDHKAVYKWQRRALERIGIDPEERKRRNISMHSWRHYFNSSLRLKGVPEHITRAIIGHSDEKMSEHYTNYNPEELAQAVFSWSDATNPKDPSD